MKNWSIFLWNHTLCNFLYLIEPLNLSERGRRQTEKFSERRFLCGVSCIIGGRYWTNRIFIRLTRRQSMHALANDHIFALVQTRLFSFAQLWWKGKQCKKNHRQGWSCAMHKHTLCWDKRRERLSHICGMCTSQNKLLYPHNMASRPENIYINFGTVSILYLIRLFAVVNRFLSYFCYDY